MIRCNRKYEAGNVSFLISYFFHQTISRLADFKLSLLAI
jgi:hypothetical protein